MNNFEIFKNVTDAEMVEMYKDIQKSKEEGLRPRRLDEYVNIIKEKCHFEMLSQATDFTVKLFYEEVAKRYFSKEI